MRSRDRRATGGCLVAYAVSVFRGVLIAFVVLLAFVAAASQASSATVSPCRQVYGNPVWSPDGTQIAYYGRRWPKPGSLGHGDPNSILQAYCTMDADGRNARPLRYTVCSEKCQDPPYQIAWLQSGVVFLRDGDVFRIVPGKLAQASDLPSSRSQFGPIHCSCEYSRSAPSLRW